MPKGDLRVEVEHVRADVAHHVADLSSMVGRVTVNFAFAARRFAVAFGAKIYALPGIGK